MEQIDVETRNKITEALLKITELTTDLFYTIPLSYKGKIFNGAGLRVQLNFIDKHVYEIAREFNFDKELVHNALKMRKEKMQR